MATLSASRLLRPSSTPDSVSSVSLQHDLYVSLNHPGYTHDTEFLCLPAYDPIMPVPSAAPEHPRPSLAAQQRQHSLPVVSVAAVGVHYGTAIAACRIVACNQPGALRNDDNHTTVTLGFGDVLPAGKYWYHLDPPGEAHYPITPCFGDWKFSVSGIPEEWYSALARRVSNLPPGPNQHLYSESQMTAAVVTRDVCCRITGFQDLCENAHLIPRAELPWFILNSMRTYNRHLRNPTKPRFQIDDPRNGVLMRQDLHTAMDNGMFCVVCKEGSFVPHFLQESIDLGRLYHNVEFRLSADACVEFLFARFAWSILGRVAAFAATRGRRIKLSSGAVANAGDGQLEISAQERTELAKSLQPPGSPKKRKIGPSGGSMSAADFRAESAKYASCSDIIRSTDDVPFYGMQQIATYEEDTISDNDLASFEPLGEPPAPSAEDIETMNRFFPEMAKDGESEWSSSYTWHTAPWYPGIERVQKLKAVWRRRQREGEWLGAIKRRRPSERDAVGKRLKLAREAEKKGDIEK